jgi:hypothetical protein
MGGLLIPGVREDALVDLRRKVFRQSGSQVFEPLAFFLDDFAVANLLLQKLFSFLSQVPFVGAIDELALYAIEIGKDLVMSARRQQGVNMILAIDRDMNRGN